MIAFVFKLLFWGSPVLRQTQTGISLFRGYCLARVGMSHFVPLNTNPGKRISFNPDVFLFLFESSIF